MSVARQSVVWMLVFASVCLTPLIFTLIAVGPPETNEIAPLLVLHVFLWIVGFAVFPLAIYFAIQESLRLWNWQQGDYHCCHMGGVSDDFAIGAVAGAVGLGAIMAIVLVGQWLLFRRLNPGLSALVALPASIAFAIQFSVASAHAWRMCGGC